MGATTVALVAALDVATLYLHRDFHHLQYNGIYYAIPGDMLRANGERDGVFNLVTYDNRIGRYCFAHAGVDGVQATHIDDLGTVADVAALVDSAARHADYIYLGIRSNEMPEVERMVMERFPVVVWENDYYGGVTKLFAKGDAGMPKPFCVAEPAAGDLLATVSFGDCDYGKNDFVDIVADVRSSDPAACLLTAELKRGDRQFYYYSNNLSDATFAIDGEWRRACLSLKLSDIDLPCRRQGVTLTVSVYGATGDSVACRQVSFAIRQGNPVVYKLNEP